MMSGLPTRTRWTRRHFCSRLAGLGLGFTVSRAVEARPMPLKLGIITDEIAADLEQALDFISRHSLAYCELRELWRQNIMNVSQNDLRRARSLIEKHHLQVSAIGSPIFKYNLPEMPARPEKRDTFHADFTDQDSDALLRKSFELARFFNTAKVRVFSYWRVDQPARVYPVVRERLARAAELAAKDHIVLVVENEHGCNVGTGKELGRVLREVDSPNLRGNWDPANAAMLNEVPYPDGYKEVRGLFEHMHVKDVRRNSQNGKLEWAPVGGGFVDWPGQLKALQHDKYHGTVSLETHYRRPDGDTVESTRESLEGLLRILNAER